MLESMNFIRRMGSGDKEPEVAGTYLVLVVILHLAGVANRPIFPASGVEWILLLLLGVGAILIRRRWLLPSTVVLALCGLAMLGVGSIGGYFLIFECIFGSFLLGSARVRTVMFFVLAAAALGLGIASWLATQNLQEVVLSLFMAGFILFIPMLWAENVRTAKELARAETQRAHALQTAATSREDRLVAEHHAARIEERTALAREMHDVLSARFSSIALLSGALLPEASHSARGPLQSIRDESVSGLEDMAGMVRMLHQGGQALQARIEDLPAVAAGFGEPVRWEYRVEDPQRFSPAVHTAAHRTVSELLVNHAKHAPDTFLELSVVQHHGLSIVARNRMPGAPGSDAPGAGIGLRNIRTRVAALDGRFALRTGEVFEARVEFPEIARGAETP